MATMTYANLQDAVEQFLQDTGAATYTTTMTDMWIAEALKEFSTYIPHMITLLFKIESRTGTDTAGTANKLTDTTKTQFTTTDDSDEKVIYNKSDHTWATATTAVASNTTEITLNANIMASGENYEIYNKRCWNNKQIYIGDALPYLWIDSVEYPIGTKRNWKIYNDVLEIDVDRVADSNLNVTSPPDIDVLVRFAMSHKLCQLADLSGQCTNIEPAGETTLAVKSLLGGATIAAGNELYIANHRTLYTVTTGVTLGGSGANNGTGNIVVYPGMEAATVANDVITFTESTLHPRHEEIVINLAIGKTILGSSIDHINAIPKGGPDTWRKFTSLADGRYEKALSDLRGLSPVQTKRRYPTA